MAQRRQISLWVKIPFTLFVAIMIPVYWIKNGPANFLWGSDIALFVTLIALWLESRMLVSMMAVGMLVPELAWNIDFLGRLMFGVDAVPGPGTKYMFDVDKSMWIRVISLFHVFLPVVVIWYVNKVGYDRKAIWWQMLFLWIVLPVSYLVGGPAANLNWTYGFGSEPQTWLPGPLYVGFLMIFFPVCIFLPTHFLLKRLFPLQNPVSSTAL